MKQYLTSRHSNYKAAFTIVELVVVIVVIGILITITAAGFSSWRTRTATTEVQTDADGVKAGMEDARNRTNGYPVFPVGTQYDGSANGTKYIYVQNKNVTITYSGGDASSYCVDIQSTAVSSVRMFLNTANGNQAAKNGTCDGGETSDPPNFSQTIFVFNTAAPGCGGTVQLPIYSPSSSSGTINWGDGATQTLSSSLQSHTYSTAGTYVATYDGPITAVSYYPSVNTTNAKCLIKVTQWGSGATPNTMNFYTASNLVYVAQPPTSVTSMQNMFNGAASFDQPINNWDMSHVTNMSAMFNGASNFNQPLDSWDTSQVTNMSNLFAAATVFNQSVNTWDTSKVTNLNYLFYATNAFNQPLDNWNTSQVTTMMAAFYQAKAFNQPLNTWNTSSVLVMGSAFRESFFNQPLNNWNTANVSDMGYMFNGDNAFNQPLNTWNTSKVTTMAQMFSNATSFNQPLNSWNTTKVTDMNFMLNNTLAFNQNISGWNVGMVTNKTGFHALSALTQANCPATLW